ncbi:MAG: hypothetical protein EBR48_01915 [bacterium]|nr:hypothetical protein [Candidatus Aquidulcis frankliniae]
MNEPQVRTQMQACVRCGAPVSLQTALCERCNPLGLAQPSASQAHGTVFLGIGAAVLLLASLAGSSSRGIGPFTASMSAAESVPGGLAVEISITNTGATAGSATCQITTSKIGSAGLSEIISTPRIEPGATTTVDRELKTFGSEPIPLAISCGN